PVLNSPEAVEALIRAVAGGSGDTGDERASTFARGLALGALVGAAIAGSTIWQRHLARRSLPTATPEPGKKGGTPQV
ncbi:MAG: hypothetical protein M3Q66_04820, partial [Chloroflexota bacterium]|nr:hypothetical protein [Chloroflexota bacterium]